MTDKHKNRVSMVAGAVAVSITFLISACATHRARTAAEQGANDHLTAMVTSTLMNDRAIYARHIDVDVDGGVVQLSGYVWSADELYEAKRVAATVPGVTRVVSQLEVMVGGRAGSR